MKRTNKTGCTCVGDLRLSPLDIGFDLRETDTKIELPAQFESVGLDIDGQTYLIEGTRDEMIQAICDAGYVVNEDCRKMTREEAIEWVREHDDQDELDNDELDAAFTAIYGRAPDDQDREEGLWSHCCVVLADETD